MFYIKDNYGDLVHPLMPVQERLTGDLPGYIIRVGRRRGYEIDSA